MLAHAEWHLKPSRQQARYDGLAMILISALIWPFLPFSMMWHHIVCVAALLVGMCWLHRMSQRRQQISRIGYRLEGLLPVWWLEINGKLVDLTIRSGSRRQVDLVVLRYGRWPWCRLLLRADSVSSNDDFRRLKAGLYGSI